MTSTQVVKPGAVGAVKTGASSGSGTSRTQRPARFGSVSRGSTLLTSGPEADGARKEATTQGLAAQSRTRASTGDQRAQTRRPADTGRDGRRARRPRRLSDHRRAGGSVPNAPRPRSRPVSTPSPRRIAWVTGGACSEPPLIELAYAFEQASERRAPPPLMP